MHEIIDVAEYVGQHAGRLAAAGVKAVIRYYNHRNGPNHPSKCLTPRELSELHTAGLSVAIVFEQRGGAEGNIGDLTAQTGARDATRALALAATMAQPNGSAIYFAVDWDYDRENQLAQIDAYFSAVRGTIGNAYLIGVYGSGAVGKRLASAGLVDHVWLAASGWTGTQEALRAGRWTLFQKHHEVTSEIGGFKYDANIVNPAAASFGQFGPAGAVATPRGVGTAALYRISARSGLNLRTGPGESYRVVRSIDNGIIVTGRNQADGWMQVDLDGDGQADGYMFAHFLDAVSGGLPVANAQARRPMDVARAELALNVSEYPGTADNPRILLYHDSTSGDPGQRHDAIAWCSSFVNYCVEQAGYVGTNSKWARSWHDDPWGHDVIAAPQEGDIVVWRRRGGGDDGGHVGFFVGEDDTGVTVLGGNQSDKVCIQRYPKAGTLGPFTYTLLSIRRA
jgi:uncharacterized protein (TIGR02594 family)